MNQDQVTFAIIKPDAVRLHLVGLILDLAYDRARLHPVAIRMHRLDAKDWAVFYAEHEGKPFFDELCRFMATDQCVFMSLQGPNAVEEWRKLMGATNPAKAAPRTLRAMYGDPKGGPANVVHGSASMEEAEREITLIAELLGE